MRQSRLLGTWRLVSWENRGAAGEVTYPLGPDPVGYLTYTADGHVFVALMRERSVTRAGRALFLSQPATSAALGRLREALKDELLVRNGRTLEPTARATALMAEL